MKEKNLFPKELSHILKGLLAFIIVGSHLHYVTSLYIWDIFNKFGTSVVAMFFFISGYGLMSSLNKNGEKYLNSFFSKRLLSIFVPFIVITIIYLFANWIFYNIVPNNIIFNLYKNGDTPLPNSWFIFSLIYFYLTFYFSFRYIRNTKIGISVVFLLSIIFIVWCMYMSYSRAWWVCALAFPTGLFISNAKCNDIVNKWYFLVASILIVLGILYINKVLLLPLTYILIPIAILSLCNLSRFSAFAVYICNGNNKKLFVRIVKNVLDFMSTISYELYLVHGAIISLLDTNGVIHSSDYVFSAVVISSSVLLAFVFNRLFSINIMKCSIGKLCKRF